MTDTLLYSPEPLDSTLISSGVGLQPVAASVAPSPQLSLRTTVLPQVEWHDAQPSVRPRERERFEEVRALGQGGMGEVVLFKDHDIERTVALKRLPQTAQVEHVLRFVQEIRTVGQLDHPNIVPVHDVGVDAQGRYFFLMKHLQGETLESIIDRLRQGDAATHARFDYPARIQVFLGVLNALAYAHGKGFLHRDLKPANIMVGPYGEVTVMDWGLARRFQSEADALALLSGGTPGEDAVRRTQLGSVMGTPLYMAPEQARGQNDAVDLRSDTYSLSVLFHEFLFLRHYLEGRTTVAQVLEGVQNHRPSILNDGAASSPYQPPVPSELRWFVNKGMAKDPAERHASAEEMIHSLRGVMDGRIHVQCSRTLAKRGLHEALRSVDTHPKLFMAGAAMTLALAGMGTIQLLFSLFG